MAKGGVQKSEYFDKVRRLFREHTRIFVVNVDNVASSQMHQIRSSLRGQATILMGKNTMVRKAMLEVLEENPKLEAIIPLIRGNIGLVFCQGDLKTIRDVMLANRVQAAAKIGLVAQADIAIPAGNTGMDPNKTSFFQALGIPTKVVKGAIEITSEVRILKEGEKVGASEAALLNMLNLMPFRFGLSILSIYDDGSVFSPAMLNITAEVLEGHMRTAIRSIAAISLAAGFPTVASAPHIVANAYKNIICIGMGLEEYSFPAAEAFKNALKNAAPAACAVASTTAAPVAAAAAAPKEESEEEEMGMGLFD